MQIFYYTVTLVFFFFTYCILNMGLNIQFGRTGILNFAYIAFVAIGAYFTGVTSMGPPVPGSHESYVIGASLPFPVPLIIGGLASCVLGLLVGLVAFRRLRSDYLAIVMISLSIVLYDVVNNYVPLFDGADGLSGGPQPFMGAFNLDANSFIWVFAIFAGVVALVGWAVMSRITRSPLDRTMRAIRDDPDVVRSLGKNPFAYQLRSLLIGSFYAGVGGGLIMYFADAFNTSSWTTPETFVIFAAVIIGGVGNNLGAILGALVVPVIFVELPKLLPQIGNDPSLLPEIDNMLIGLLLIGTLWFRSQGLIPEARTTAAALAGRGWRLPWWPRPAASPSGVERVEPAAPLRPGSSSVPPARTPASTADDADAPAAAAVEVADLRKGFGGVQAVNGATFAVSEGTVCALIGPNGAGKSTAVNLIAGSLRPDGGTVRLFGEQVTGLAPERIARRGLVRTFQLSREFGRMTVLENLMVTPLNQTGESVANVFLQPRKIRLEERETLDRALSVLSTYGLYELRDSYARELSGGQKRLLELARAVMAQPRMLLLDEPMAGINPALIDQIGTHILALRDAGVTVLMVEHNLGVVERICDHVIVMAEGRTLATGVMSELREHPEVVRAYLGGALSASVAR